MRSHAPGIRAVEATSHQLLATAQRPPRDRDDSGGKEASLPTPCLAAALPPGVPLDFVWLDYCGTFQSSAGRARQQDLQELFQVSLSRHFHAVFTPFSHHFHAM